MPRLATMEIQLMPALGIRKSRGVFERIAAYETVDDIEHAAMQHHHHVAPGMGRGNGLQFAGHALEHGTQAFPVLEIVVGIAPLESRIAGRVSSWPRRRSAPRTRHSAVPAFPAPARRQADLGTDGQRGCPRALEITAVERRNIGLPSQRPPTACRQPVALRPISICPECAVGVPPVSPWRTRQMRVTGVVGISTIFRLYPSL